jgi:hypothetical protein
LLCICVQSFVPPEPLARYLVEELRATRERRFWSKKKERDIAMLRELTACCG